MDLVETVKEIQVHDETQDQRLTVNDGKFDDIYEALKIPLQRLDTVDHLINIIQVDLKNKISIQDLYAQLKHKAPLEKVKQIEQSVI